MTFAELVRNVFLLEMMIHEPAPKKIENEMNSEKEALTDEILLQLATKYDGIEDFLEVRNLFHLCHVYSRESSAFSDGRLICFM